MIGPEDSDDDAEKAVPVLSIVHVSDLHVKATCADLAHPLKNRRLRRAILRKLVEKDSFGFEEGTQGHYPKAPRSFSRFLSAWGASLSNEWKQAPIWLVDTGDLTAFGDEASTQLGKKYLLEWSNALGNCPIRSLYGNHDAWPGTQPMLASGDIPKRKAFVENSEFWQPQRWISEPLTARLPRWNGEIQLFGLNSVCWDAWKNVRAVGELTEGELTGALKEIGLSVGRCSRALRIGIMHHPLAFPWFDEEVRLPLGGNKMRLLNDQECADTVGNDGDDPAGAGPWFHLLLSGHTHMRYPADQLNMDTTSIHQGYLKPSQLQLVGGSLMLNKSIRQTRSACSLVPTDRKVERYSHTAVDPGTCQAHILQFFDQGSGRILMTRTVISSEDGGATYHGGEPDWVEFNVK